MIDVCIVRRREESAPAVFTFFEGACKLLQRCSVRRSTRPLESMTIRRTVFLTTCIAALCAVSAAAWGSMVPCTSRERNVDLWRFLDRRRGRGQRDQL